MEMDIKIKHISFFLTLNVTSQCNLKKIVAFKAFKHTESLEALNICYINIFKIFIVFYYRYSLHTFIFHKISILCNSQALYY